jgi:hypothetical protein
MKKVLLFSILVCLFLIQGCAGGQWINAKFTPINPNVGGYLKNYTLGERKTAFIGQEIIKVEICDGLQNTVRLGRDNTINDTYYYKKIYLNQNTICPIVGTVEYDGKTYYVTSGLDNYNMGWGILISDDGSINKSGLYSHHYERLYLADSVVINPDKVVYSTSCIRATPRALSFELIFAGANDVSLNTTYKEYSYNDLARPAFFQNLTYQSNAKQIRFKDFLIHIHNVTNEQITYTVLEDGLK